MTSKVERVCKNCGTSFLARKADVDRGWAIFCSKSCKAKEQEKRTGQFAEYCSSKKHYEEEVDYEGNGWDAHKDIF